MSSPRIPISSLSSPTPEPQAQPVQQGNNSSTPPPPNNIQWQPINQIISRSRANATSDVRGQTAAGMPIVAAPTPDRPVGRIPSGWAASPAELAARQAAVARGGSRVDLNDVSPIQVPGSQAGKRATKSTPKVKATNASPAANQLSSRAVTAGAGSGANGSVAANQLSSFSTVTASASNGANSSVTHQTDGATEASSSSHGTTAFPGIRSPAPKKRPSQEIAPSLQQVTKVEKRWDSFFSDFHIIRSHFVRETAENAELFDEIDNASFHGTCDLGQAIKLLHDQAQKIHQMMSSGETVSMDAMDHVVVKYLDLSKKLEDNIEAVNKLRQRLEGPHGHKYPVSIRYEVIGNQPSVPKTRKHSNKRALSDVDSNDNGFLTDDEFELKLTGKAPKKRKISKGKSAEKPKKVNKGKAVQAGRAFEHDEIVGKRTTGRKIILHTEKSHCLAAKKANKALASGVSDLANSRNVTMLDQTSAGTPSQSPAPVAVAQSPAQPLAQSFGQSPAQSLAQSFAQSPVQSPALTLSSNSGHASSSNGDLNEQNEVINNLRIRLIARDDEVRDNQRLIAELRLEITRLKASGEH